MKPARSCLVTSDNTPIRPSVPAIDAHNHLWGAWETIPNVAQVMDEVGVEAYCDVSANISLKWVEGGYSVGAGDINDFFEKCSGAYPGRFYCFTTATFTGDPARPLFGEPAQFTEQTLALLHDHVKRGARGLKIFKELGLKYRDANGNLLRIDDETFAPVWEEAGKLDIPVLMHQSDPKGFFDPVTPENEHYDSLKKYPSWSFHGHGFPSKDEILERRDNVIRSHPGTTFMLPHVANLAEDLQSVGRLLDECPNVFIDFSARMDELGRQPYSTRDFFIRFQDRIYFGTDMPASPEMYRCHFRFLETFDEAFVPPDYDGTFERCRWRICGIGLPREVLEKIYRGNIMRIIPSLREQSVNRKKG